MAISMADHFKLQKKAQNFERDSFPTLKEMREFNTNYLPDIFTATCSETGKFYIFNINNEDDVILGKWREITEDDLADWVKAPNKPDYTASEVNAVPTADELTINEIDAAWQAIFGA